MTQPIAKMPQNDSDELPTRLHWLRRTWRYPFFAKSWCVHSILLLAFLCWIVIDAQFGMTLFVMRHQSGIESVPYDSAKVPIQLWDMMWNGLNAWDALGPRLFLFRTLSFLLVASFSLMIVDFARRATIRRMLVFVFSISAWLAIWTCYTDISSWSVLRRANRELPRFESLAQTLLQQWPTKNGTHAETGDYYVSSKNPNVLMLPGRGYPVHEDFGHEIERSTSGQLRFALSGAADYKIEYHPLGFKPSSYKSIYGNTLSLQKSEPLQSANWFLVRYGEPNGG